MTIEKKKSIVYIHLFCLDFSFHCITIRKLCILFLLVICKSTLDTKENKQKKNCHDYTIHNFSNISKLHNIWCLNPFQVSSCIFVLFLLLLLLSFSLHFIPHSYIFFWPFSVFYLVLLIYFVLSFYFSAFSLLYLFCIFSVISCPCYCNLVHSTLLNISILYRGFFILV